MKLSVVTTLYRSAGHLEEFHARVTAAARRLTEDYELVLVHDGSPDDSLARAIALHSRDPRVRIVDLSRNFGHHRAIMTGLAHVRGERVFLIDCDLEEDPELLQRFDAEMTRSGADVVYGVQAERKGGAFERLSGWLFFSAFNLLSTDPLPRNLTTVRLMTRRYVDALLQYREREMVIAGLWVITGFQQVGVEVNKGSRDGSSYTISRKIAHVVNSITSFSNRPLVFIFYLGCVIVVASGTAASYLIIRRMFFGVLLSGWPSLIVSIWLLGGLNLFCIGIIGIYLSKVFVETKQRPYTIVRRLYERTPDDADA
jgi:putative glycosyltransferase